MDREGRQNLDLALQQRLNDSDAVEVRRQSAFSHVMDGIISTDDGGIVTAFNPAASRIFGYSAEQVIGRSITMLISEPFHALPTDQADVPRSSNIRHKLIGRRRDGSTFPVDVAISTRRVAGTNHFTGIVRDIAEKQTQDKARDALLARAQLGELPLAYLQFGPDFRINDWSPAAERLFGYSKQEMLGVGPPYEPIVPSSFWDAGEKLLTRIITGDMDAHSVNENLTKDGRAITCQWINTPLVEPDGSWNGFMCLAQEVPEQNVPTEQTPHSHRLETIGLLASGVAHDFNNLLTIINGYSDIIAQQVPANRSVQDSVGKIGQACARATMLTRQLLSFDASQVSEAETVNLNAILIRIERMLRRVIGEEIRLSTMLAHNLCEVTADVAQIEQVILSLVLNARDAMPGGGLLRVETANIELDQLQSRAYPEMPPGSYVAIRVHDSGTGIDQATQDRLIQTPSARVSVNESGVGLETGFELARQAGGHVTVTSQPGAGTTATFYLPTISSTSDSTTTITHTLRRDQGTETILLAEDEPVLRTLTRHILAAHGYTVLDAANAQDAVQLVEQCSEEIHLLITDVVMPETRGTVLAEQLVVLKPAMRVLYVSGVAHDAALGSGVLDSSAAYLQKPFTPESLAAKVREVLDRRPSTEVSADEAQRNATILVIDDDEQFQDLMQMALTKHGYSVRRARNGKIGVREYRQAPVDLVLCDIFMEGQDGLETIRQLRSEFADVKIIAVSGGGVAGSFLEHARKFGAVDSLQKPFGMELLLKTIRDALRT